MYGFWFTQLVTVNACQKAFVTSYIGDFGLLLGILGFYWITRSFEFQDLFEIFNNLIYINEIHFLFVTLCASLLFVDAVAKSVQFPLHVLLLDAMERPTPISALIHVATMVVAGIFLVARILPLLIVLIVIPYIMNLISLIVGLYDVSSRYGVLLSHYISFDYSCLFEIIVVFSIWIDYSFYGSYCWISPEKNQNMVFMSGLRKHVPITQNTFLVAWSIVGLTIFYVFQIYLRTFEGHLYVHFKKYSGKKIALSIK
uniref:NADH:quinone oxidoreductase/Mrp antiporter transmembrane domain-containing protein n=1 Tax=Gossypium raimondii TaxID=29730 RepID=A0A0D2MCP6_GOSRA|nr:hypothetical protein B456_002G182500 [Gossypium raimondii]